MRKPQQNLAPPTRKTGDAFIADVLWRALQVAAESSAAAPAALAAPVAAVAPLAPVTPSSRGASDAPAAKHDVPHGFHSWPAGMNKDIARVVLDGFDGPGLVVDPFSGGGTVGLEAVLHRRPFVGVDLNPLAARVGFQRSRPRSDPDAAAVEAAVDAVTERSKDRVRAKVRTRADIPVEVAKAFLPHTMAELAGLIEEIGNAENDDDRKLMAVVFSSILTKVSLKKGDTDSYGQPSKRVARFFPSEVFQEKAHELLDRQRVLFRRLLRPGQLRLPEDFPRPRFIVDDARALPQLVQGVKLIVTSPPYGGTYDYAAHHEHRIAFLGLDDTRLRELEIGARRRQDSRYNFDKEIFDMLQAMGLVLDDDGLAVLVLGDGVVEGQRIAADQHIASLCKDAGLEIAATASAPRTDWRGGPDREEHLIALRRLPARRR